MWESGENLSGRGREVEEEEEEEDEEVNCCLSGKSQFR